MRRGEIWTVAGGKDYAGKPRPVVIVQDNSFDATDSMAICAFTTDPTRGRPGPVSLGAGPSRIRIPERAIAGEREARRRRIAISRVPPYCRVRRTTSCLSR